MISPELEIQNIVNVDKYPLPGTQSSLRNKLVESLRTGLKNNLYCALPEFVTAPALEAMAAEAKQLQHAAYHNNSLRNCYLHQKLNSDFNSEHPRNLRDRSSTRMIAYDQLPEASPLSTLYRHDAVRSWVADIVGEGELFMNEDPFQPANYVCYQNGDESSWHFDADNSFTMTLMIQPADVGGNFEISLHTRTDSEQNYNHVADVLRGERNDTVTAVGRDPGELCIFRGRNSLHRVTPVIGDTLRIMGVFVYEYRPGLVGDPKVNATIYGPRTSG